MNRGGVQAVQKLSPFCISNSGWVKNEDNSEKKITLCENEDNSRLRRVAMPSGMAAQVRELLASSDKTGLVLQRAPPGSRSSTGFVNVIKVKDGLFQARLQVKGDGRGGEKKRRQVAIPGLFKTAEEAAQLLALIKKIGPKTLWPEEGLPPKAGQAAQAAQPCSSMHRGHACPPGRCSHASHCSLCNPHPLPCHECAPCSCLAAPDDAFRLRGALNDRRLYLHMCLYRCEIKITSECAKCPMHYARASEDSL